MTVKSTKSHSPVLGGGGESRTRALWGHLPVVLLLAIVWLEGISFSQTSRNGASKPNTGKEIFQAACVGCHGQDGKGAPRASIGFEPPSTFPDFTDCNATTREDNPTWKSIVHYGGPSRGFSEIMPSFTEALTAEQIEKVVQYVRGFCREPSWPRGELNLPRTLFTEKAFPEDEVVVETTIDTKTTSGQVMNNLVYERRLSNKNQLEFNVPVGAAQQGSGSWAGGVGDVTLGYKRLIASSLRTGSIFSVSAEATLPTGNKTKGLGTGTTILEGFAAYDQLLPKNTFLQFQSGFEIPTDQSQVNKALYWRTAVGQGIRQGHFGRLWSPMLEVLADREFATGQKTNWDVVPEVQVTLSRRQHVRGNFGIRFPVNNTASRPIQVVFYLLWDWFDGGLRDGWR